MPRFVLLRHDVPPHVGASSHWDLMLEQGAGLLTWRLESLPATWQTELMPPASGEEQPGAQNQIMATRLVDHRLAYLDYQGPIALGRGEVRRVDRGVYRMLNATADLFHVELRGASLRDQVRLEQVAGDQWRLLTGDR